MNFISVPFLRSQLKTAALKAIQLTHATSSSPTTAPNTHRLPLHSPQTAPHKAKAGLLLGGSFWLAFLGASVLWFNSAQAAHEEQVFDKPNVEDPRIVLVRGNLQRFLREAPRRELIVAPMPHGLSRPKEITLYLSPAWDRESPETRQRLAQTWETLWTESVETHPRDARTPRLYLSRSKDVPASD